jgi:hypothetical protein
MQRATIRTQAAVNVKAMATQRKSGSAKKGASPAAAGAAGRTLWLPNTVRQLPRREARCAAAGSAGAPAAAGGSRRARLLLGVLRRHPSQEFAARARRAARRRASLIAARSRRPPPAGRPGVAGRLPAGCVAAPARLRPILLLTRQNEVSQ